jgi:hypothetical protein
LTARIQDSAAAALVQVVLLGIFSASSVAPKAGVAKREPSRVRAEISGDSAWLELVLRKSY